MILLNDKLECYLRLLPAKLMTYTRVGDSLDVNERIVYIDELIEFNNLVLNYKMQARK